MQHIQIKLFAAEPAAYDPSVLIGIFHRWIQQARLPELMIDVADYSHVPDGPGIMLIGHEANYSVDFTGGRAGLLYSRKACLEGTSLQRLRHAYESACRAAEMLAAEPELEGRLQFTKEQFLLVFNDRLLYPNTPETWAALQPEVSQFLQEALAGKTYLATRDPDPRRRLEMLVKGGV